MRLRIAHPLILVLCGLACLSNGCKGAPPPPDRIFAAIESNDATELALLIKAGVSVDQDSIRLGTPLLWASGYCDETIVVMLLNAGANPNQGSKLTYSLGSIEYPLNMAAASGRPSIVQKLIDAGAKVDRVTRLGQTALHAVAIDRQPRVERRVEVVRLLLENGVPIDAVDNDGETALDCAEVGKPDEVARGLRQLGKRAAELKGN